eukprot:1948623-Pyramimonas_sp.AAC.1
MVTREFVSQACGFTLPAREFVSQACEFAPFPPSQVRAATIGGMAVGGAGQWNRAAWLEGRSAADPPAAGARRLTDAGAGFPDWLQARPTCLDPRLLQQLDAAPLPSGQARASAELLASLYTGLREAGACERRRARQPVHEAVHHIRYQDIVVPLTK